MASSHEEWQGKVKLDDDDIQAIQALYGKSGDPRPESGDPSLGRGPGTNGPARGPGGPRGPNGPRMDLHLGPVEFLHSIQPMASLKSMDLHSLKDLHIMDVM